MTRKFSTDNVRGVRDKYQVCVDVDDDNDNDDNDDDIGNYDDDDDDIDKYDDYDDNVDDACSGRHAGEYLLRSTSLSSFTLGFFMMMMMIIVMVILVVMFMMMIITRAMSLALESQL